MKLPRIVLDLGGLDLLGSGGQFRYVVDLVRSLADRELPARFIVLGGAPRPIDALQPAFDRAAEQWTYRHFRRSTGRGAIYRDFLRLALVLARVRADLCHCLHTFAPVVAPCPVVVSVLDLMYELFPEYAEAVRSRPYRIYRWAVHHCVRRAICISQTTASDLARLWDVPRERQDVVYPGLRVFDVSLTTSAAPVNAALGKLGHAQVISSPLNLEPRKNLPVLLRALARVVGRFPEVRLVLFGMAGWTEDREAHYRSALAQLGLTRFVIETGLVSDSDLWWLYRRSTVFAFPSLYEGFGYPVLEAMAAGACPVVRGCSAMAEVVGESGVLVEPITEETLADAFIRLLGNQQARLSLGQAARQRASLFTSARMAQETFACYRTALGQG
jgi:glycosyltransferase involved in cell wall biosynthesis